MRCECEAWKYLKGFLTYDYEFYERMSFKWTHCPFCGAELGVVSHG